MRAEWLLILWVGMHMCRGSPVIVPGFVPAVQCLASGQQVVQDVRQGGQTWSGSSAFRAATAEKRPWER
jgi:hypothetical protein